MDEAKTTNWEIRISESGIEESMEQLIIQTQGVKILVVDDSQPNLLIAKGVLERYGIAVTTAQSGREAVELVKENEFDLVILDCVMPEMDGHDTAQAIRALPGVSAKVPIVAYTSNKADETLEGYEDVGVKEVLEKPLNIVELSKILLKHLAPGKMFDEQEVIRKLNISGDLNGAGAQREESELKKALSVISGLDYAAGLHYAGGTDEGYLNVIKATCKTMGEALERLEAYYRCKTEKGYYEEWCGDTDPVRDYGCNGARIDTHSMKGICAGIGLDVLSKDSAVMERMATQGDEISLLGDMKPYIMQLQYYYEALTNAIVPFLQEAEEQDADIVPMEASAYAELWKDTEESIEMFDIDAIQEGLKRLYAATERGEKRDALKEAMEASEVFDYTKVAELLEKYR